MKSGCGEAGLTLNISTVNVRVRCLIRYSNVGTASKFVQGVWCVPVVWSLRMRGTKGPKCGVFPRDPEIFTNCCKIDSVHTF